MSPDIQMIFGVTKKEDIEEIAKEIKKNKRRNPCIKLYGDGPEQKTCADCKHLYMKRYSHNIYKCDLRKDTGQWNSDHRKSWPACAKWEI